MHGSQHTRHKLVYTIAFLNKRDQSCNATFIIERVAQTGKHRFLKLVDVILQTHHVANCLETVKKC